MYKIKRFYRNSYTGVTGTRIIKRNLTLEQAQAHCKREDTHKKDKIGDVIWFDGYTEQ